MLENASCVTGAHVTSNSANPIVAHCHFGFGKLYGRLGKREEAQEHFTISAEIYREMDMRSWLEKAEVEVSRL